ncbi:MAG: NAD-dependent malic enzyme [Planctomycetes bacterium]|nr:NAD-dependent malic enzyme [Planctomycetota bacterium]
MNQQFKIKEIKGKNVLFTGLRGSELISFPLLNKGTAFTSKERAQLGLKGLIPTRIFRIEQQLIRVFENFQMAKDDLDKFIYLQALMDRNETLYYKLVLDHLEMMLPIIYTPTVGTACKQFAHIFRRPRGMYITPEDEKDLDRVIGNWPYDDVKVAVITDGERILGLGDLGANGMGIPIGKLALYTIAAGINPIHTMPICLDVGSNNEQILNDPVYLGRRKKRIDPQKLDKLVGKVITALNKRFKNILIQFEDFALKNSFRLLDKFQDKVCCFNDDIQGTAAVTVAGILSSLRITGKQFSDLKFVIAGAGSAGIGIANHITNMLRSNTNSTGDILDNVYILKSSGLLDHKTISYDFQKSYARDTSKWGKTDLLSVVKHVKPDVLIGTTGQPNLFSKEIIQEMAKSCERPLIMPLSNPTSCCEAIPTNVIEFTKGRALIATGSPFPPTTYNGKLFRISQCNNVYIFPGIGLGVISSKAKRVTNNMFINTSLALSSMLDKDDLKLGRLYPELKEIRNISVKIATEVVKQGIKDEVCDIDQKKIQNIVKNNIWEPEYIPYRLDKW